MKEYQKYALNNFTTDELKWILDRVNAKNYLNLNKENLIKLIIKLRIFEAYGQLTPSPEKNKTTKKSKKRRKPQKSKKRRKSQKSKKRRKPQKSKKKEKLKNFKAPSPLPLSSCKTNEDCPKGYLCLYDTGEKKFVCRSPKPKPPPISIKGKSKKSKSKSPTKETKKKRKPRYYYELDELEDQDLVPNKGHKGPPSPFTVWPQNVSPGVKGINTYIQKTFLRYSLFNNMIIQCTKKMHLLAFQYFVYVLVKPLSIINRLLCVHRTGSGKTLTMIMCLNNFFYDNRPKIIIFPTQSVAQNFYGEIMKFPNLYREYVIKRLGERVVENLYSKNRSIAAAARLKVADLLAMKRELRYAGDPGFPGGPMRSYRYSQSPSLNDPIFRTRLAESNNPYDGKIIIMDEIHNLVVPSLEMSRYRRKLNTMKSRLKNCENSVVLGFTATPFVNDLREGRELLDVVRGGRKQSNEGYISYFNNLPTSIYPQVFPENAIGDIIRVKLDGPNEEYYRKEVRIHGERPKDPPSIQRLMGAANLSTYYGSVWQTNFMSNLKKNPELYATKLYKIALDVIKNNQKTLIIIHRREGFKCLKEIFKIVANKQISNRCTSKCLVALYDKGAKGASTVQKFNSPENSHGDEILTMVVDAQNYSEGVSFFGVRKLILTNPPMSVGNYLQRIGRVLRSCSYMNLPPNQRNVKIYMYISENTIDEYLLRELIQNRSKYERDMKEYFEYSAMDRGFYEPGFIKKMRTKQLKIKNPVEIAKPYTI